MHAISRLEYEAAVLPHLDELYGTAVRLTRSRVEADDLLQEAMTRAWTFWDRFETGTNARAWMHRILRNTFINGYRRRRREREILREVETEPNRGTLGSGPCVEAPDGFGDEVEAALGGLSPAFHAVVDLVDVRGLSYQETAERLGVPVGTVMSRLHRARRALQESLRDYAAGEGYLGAA